MPKLRVRDLMTPDPLVVCLDDSLATIRELMSEKHIRHVPVVDNRGDLVGLVSERDLLRRAAGFEGSVPLSLDEEIAASVKVREIMTWEVETVEADEDVATAASVMLENKYGCLPVLEQGVLAGILTEADFVRHVAEDAADDSARGGKPDARPYDRLSAGGRHDRIVGAS
ncbi:MAG TPA: CBS domain-containing protein [Vicinamibacterales bacterium]